MLADYGPGKKMCDRSILCSVGLVDAGHGYGSVTEVTEVPDTGIEVLPNSQRFWVRVCKSKIAHKRYGKV